MRMKKPLTDKQKIVFSIIKDFITKNGRAPTLKEILAGTKGLLKLKSISSVQRHYNALKKKDYLTSKRYQARSLRIKSLKTGMVNIPLVGAVAAGQPILAQENIEAYIAYSASKLSGDPKKYFFLRAVGDSMNTADINGKSIDSGDFVLIKSQSTAEPGQRIVALIGDEATIKKYRPQKNMVVLAPESSNKANKEIYVFDDFLIQGVIKDVIKKGDKK